MKKVISITLGSRVFSIEEDAYELLAGYIDSVKKHFAADESSQEIIDDMEAGIAEKLGRKKSVVTHTDVQSVIEEMGTVHDFDKFAEDRESTEPQNANKRLYRNPDDKVIAGVASGLAAYLNVSPLYVRLAFLIALLFWGTSALIYVILWIIIPEAKTKSEKLAMQGSPVSLATLKSTMGSDLERVGAKSASFLDRLFALIGTVFQTLFKFIRGLLRIILRIFRYGGGVALVIGSTVALLGATFLFIVLLLESATPYVDPLTVELFRDFGGYIKLMLLGFGYLAVSIPLLGILVLGVSVIRRHNLFKPLISASLVVLWFLSLIGLGANVLKIFPVVEERVQALEAQIQEEQREFTDLEDFNSIVASGSYVIQIEQGEETRVVAQGAQDVLAELSVESRDGQLEIDHRYEGKICLFICPSRRVELLITTPDIQDITLSGSTRGAIRGFDGDNVNVSLQGSSRLLMDVSVQTLMLQARGSSRVALTGSAEQFDIDLQGSSRIYAYSFVAEDVTVRAAGSSTTEVAPTRTLRAHLSGSNIVRYIGEDVEVRSSDSPSSLVRRIEPNEIDYEIVDDQNGFEILPLAPLPPAFE